MRHAPALRLRDCQPGQNVHLRGPKGYPFVSIDGHVRLHYGERGDRYGKLWLSKEDHAAGKPWAVMACLGHEVKGEKIYG
jgi:hypothetical protein